MRVETTDDFYREQREQRRRDRQLAARLVAAAREGDAEAFEAIADGIGNETLDGWRYALLGFARLDVVSEAVRWGFLTAWVTSKGLTFTSQGRPVVARALRVMLPRVQPNGSLELWRGASATERRNAAYGFSWTTRRTIAMSFAELSARWPSGGVLLRTLAAPDAVLHMRESGRSYDEGEVIVDPYRLSRVVVVERLASTYPPDQAVPLE